MSEVPLVKYRTARVNIIHLCLLRVAMEVRYNSCETAIIGDLPDPANIDSDLLRPQDLKAGPAAVYPLFCL